MINVWYRIKTGVTCFIKDNGTEWTALNLIPEVHDREQTAFIQLRRKPFLFIIRHGMDVTDLLEVVFPRKNETFQSI